MFLVKPLASFVSHYGLGIYNSFRLPYLQHSENLIFCFTFLLSSPHPRYSPNSATWPLLVWLLISFLLSILRKALSKSCFLISATSPKSLLWCCVEKSTKAPEEAVFRTGVSTSNVHGSQVEIIWTGAYRIIHVPPKWGMGVVTTQPQTTVASWECRLYRIFQWSPNQDFYIKYVKCWLLRKKKKNLNLIKSLTVTINYRKSLRQRNM